MTGEADHDEDTGGRSHSRDGCLRILLAGCVDTVVDEVLSAPASPPPADVTTINGEVPPGPATKVDESITLLDVVDDGIQHLVYQDTRSPGTRSPIHEHPFGGTTCVISGQMTLFLEGSEPQVANKGPVPGCHRACRGDGASTGVDYAVMIDTFAVPPGVPVWWVVEWDRRAPPTSSAVAAATPATCSRGRGTTARRTGPPPAGASGARPPRTSRPPRAVRRRRPSPPALPPSRRGATASPITTAAWMM